MQIAGGGAALPAAEYPSFDEQPIVDAVREIRRSIYQGAFIDDWLESVADAIENTARMLAARGTESFLTYNRPSTAHRTRRCAMTRSRSTSSHSGSTTF